MRCDRLTAAAKREGIVFGRLQQHVGVLVVAQFMNLAAVSDGAPMLLVKGGASLELRRGIPESRSKDLDAVVRGDVETVHKRLTLVGLSESVAVRCMTLPWQIAQKIHACTEPVEVPRTNDRARDRVDLQLLEALTVDDPLADTEAACRAVFEARSKHAWPPIVAVQSNWDVIYVRAWRGSKISGSLRTLDDAVMRVQNFIDRIVGSGSPGRPRTDLSVPDDSIARVVGTVVVGAPPNVGGPAIARAASGLMLMPSNASRLVR